MHGHLTYQIQSDWQYPSFVNECNGDECITESSTAFSGGRDIITTSWYKQAPRLTDDRREVVIGGISNVVAIQVWYCKSHNIRSAFIFVNFAQNSASANSKTRKNICDILYAHFEP